MEVEGERRISVYEEAPGFRLGPLAEGPGMVVCVYELDG
jgi:hypothetical protein